MSRAQLADLVGINVQSVGALERGDNYPSLDLAFRICEVFGLPVEAVFSRTEFTAMSAELYAQRIPPAPTPLSRTTPSAPRLSTTEESR